MFLVHSIGVSRCSIVNNNVGRFVRSTRENLQTVSREKNTQAHNINNINIVFSVLNCCYHAGSQFQM